MQAIIQAILNPRAWVAVLLIFAATAAFFGLGFLDYLEPVAAFLDSEQLSFKIGDMRFSAFLLIKALITIMVVFWIAGIISQFASKRINAFGKIKSSNRSLIVKSLQILIYFAAATIALDVFGFDLTTLTIFSGAVGIGVGIGLQKIASNFISGIILLFEKSLEDDDLIELTDGTFGFIRHTGARYTLVETHDGREVMIPNEDFITSRVTNWTYSNKKGRIEIMVGVSYGSDVDLAIDLMLEAARGNARCARDPEPVCYMREFADSSINLLLQFWVDDVTLGRYEPQSDVMRAIWKSFRENDIEIPFPQRDIHMKNVGGAS
jgi:small-conductance mechanosensitive channel